MSSYKVEQLPAPHHNLAEGPHWDVKSQTLYYVDILKGTVHRYSESENKIYTAKVGEFVYYFHINYIFTRVFIFFIKNGDEIDLLLFLKPLNLNYPEQDFKNIFSNF